MAVFFKESYKMSNNNKDLDDSRFRITPVQQMAAACSGALLTSLMVTPLDVVKIRLQAQQKALTKCFVYCNGLMDHLCPCLTDTPQHHTLASEWYQRPGKFTGTLDAFAKITRAEGVSSLWSGLSPTLVLAIPSTVVYFVTYEQFRVRLNDAIGVSSSSQPFWVPLMAGATARTWAATLVSPLELIRTKMQSQKLSYLEMGQAIRVLMASHGVLGLWKGLGSTLLRDVPFSALYWLHYEGFKSFVSSNNNSNFTTMHAFAGGALAGSIAALVTTPFDVVKTHKQIELGETVFYADTPKMMRESTLSVLQRVYQSGGLRGVFAGLTPRLVKVAPACAIMVSSFEYGKAFFQNYNRQRWELSNSLAIDN